MATITAAAGSTNWTTAAFGAQAATTTADDVIIPTGASVTITAANNVLCKSLSVTGTGTLIFAATTSQISIGGTTAGASNVALSIASGATITLTGVGTINFISTSATQQTITTNGKTLPGVTFNGAGSSYILSDNLTLNTIGGVLTHTAGTVDFNSKTISALQYSVTGSTARTVTYGSASITLSRNNTNIFDATTITNLTITANTATFTLSGQTSGALVLGGANWNGASFVLNSTNQTSASTNAGGATVANFTWVGPATKTSAPVFVGNLTLTGAWSWTGNSAVNRSILAPPASAMGTPITISAATNTNTSNVDFMDITFAGAATWSGTSVGDCGGNSGFTFTTPTTQTNTGATGNWSDSSKWTSRVPLPQDDVIVNTGSGTITFDMPRIGKNITTTGFTGIFTINTSGGWTVYGSLTFSAGHTTNITQGVFFNGRSSYTITSAGVSFSNLAIQAVGGTYTLTDALAATGSTVHTDGTFNTNGYSLTTVAFTSSGTRTRALTLGSSTVNLTSTATTTVWNITATGLTISATSSTIVISTASANARSIVGAAFNYGTLSYTVAGSTGQLNIINGQFFDTINFSDANNARTLALTSAVSFGFRVFNVFGTSGKLMTVKSITASSATFIELIGAVNTSMDYLSVQDVWSTIPGKFYVGTNSTSVSGNTNINIAAAPSPGPYIDFYAAASTSGSSITANFSSWQVPVSGRKLHAVYSASAAATTINTPSGWTAGTANGSTQKAFSKISDGTETGVTFTTSGAPAVVTAYIIQLGGFSGTPTFDVSETNSSGGATALNSTASTGPTNTGTPAIALAHFGASGSMSSSVSATNGFEYGREQLTVHRLLAKTLFTTGAVSTTYTWTTNRTPVSLMVVYKDVTLAALSMLSMMGVGT